MLVCDTGAMIEHYPHSLGVQRFSQDALHRFAALSGDCNPIHMGAVVAPGAIVHGALTLIWCLDRAAAQLGDIEAVSSLRVNFDRFLTAGEPIEALLLSQTADRLRIAARAGDALVMTALLGIGAAPPLHAVAKPSAVFAITSPLHPNADAMSAMAGQIPFAGAAERWVNAFPHACRVFGVQRVAALGAASTLVGMVCPGLYSIFNRITLSAAEDDGDPSLGFRTTSADPALRRVAIAVWGGGWSGTLIAMMRTQPDRVN